MAKEKEGARRPRTGEARFAAYLDEIAAVLGRANRAAAARAYCTGLLLPGERKSIEPMAARIAPDRVQAAHQSLHHVVAQAEWDDAAVLRAVRERVLPAIERHGPVRYWIVDDTAFPKQGTHSVGVARQYCGQLGKQENCQVAVSLSVANDQASLPIAWRLYLPEAWAEDPARRAKAGVPEAIGFQTKTAIALGQMRRALEDGVPGGVVLADAGYGDEADFRVGVDARGRRYVLGIRSATTVWPPGDAPLPPAPWSGRGRPPTRLRRDPEHRPVSVKDLALGLPSKAWRRVTWREGSQAELSWTLALSDRIKQRRTSARPGAAGGVAVFLRFVRVPAKSDNRPATGSGSPPPRPRGSAGRQRGSPKTSAPASCTRRRRAPRASRPSRAASSAAHKVTSENRPSSNGVVRWIARSDHCRWVSNPRWRRASWKVGSTAQRIAYHVRICNADCSGSGQTNTCVSARPVGSLVSTQRTGMVLPCALHNAVLVATSTARSARPSFVRHPGMVMRAHLVALRTARVRGASWRVPTTRDLPFWPCLRGRGGLKKRASMRQRTTHTTRSRSVQNISRLA